MLNNRNLSPAYSVLLDDKAYSEKVSEDLSFKNYKIDYSRCLGSGVFGTVYEVCPRPENEKGFLSNWFPYIYDYIYPVNSLGVESRKYCVKITKTCFRICYEDSLGLQLPIMSFFERAIEKKSNEILQKHGITKIRFFKTNSFYSQFKTIVHGKTFKFYVEKKFFTMQDQFLLRKSFVTFLRLIKKSKLKFEDVHSQNIMYDEQEKRWDIVDGDVTEKDEENYDFLANLIFYKKNKNVATQYVLEKLLELAQNDSEYTAKIDADLLDKMASYRPTITQEYSKKLGF